MERKVLITECYNRYLTALLENNEIVELHYFPKEIGQACSIGEIYVGKVQKILPNINAAFVEIGKGMECYYSLEEKYELIYTSKLSKKKELCVGDELLVQVQKDAIKTKLPMVSGNLNFTGNYVVLTTGNGKIGVSSKLPKEKRDLLLGLGEEYKDKTYGIIFRTNAAGVPFSEIREEIERLETKLTHIVTYGKMRTCYSKLLVMPNSAIAKLRDFRKEGLTEIVVDATIENGDFYRRAEEFLKDELPEYSAYLRAYSDKTYAMNKCYRLEHFTEEACKEEVWMKSGAYLVIQPTEALTVIDVNSGKCLKNGKSFFDINLEAAKEAAKQIRLRNLTGIILVDFVNMQKSDEKEQLLKYFQQELNRDSNPGIVVDMTKLQLVEVTRKKGRKTLEESLHG